ALARQRSVAAVELGREVRRGGVPLRPAQPDRLPDRPARPQRAAARSDRYPLRALPRAQRAPPSAAARCFGCRTLRKGVSTMSSEGHHLHDSGQTPVKPVVTRRARMIAIGIAIGASLLALWGASRFQRPAPAAAQANPDLKVEGNSVSI